MNTTPTETRKAFDPSRSKHFIPLDNIQVASPCRADWNLMQGDDRVRFCQSCAKNVYNLSALSRDEAEQLIREKEGELCVRYFQRSDGTVITANCPVGLRSVRRPFKWLLAGFAALMASGAALTAKECPPPAQTPDAHSSWKANLLHTLQNRFSEVVEPEQPPVIMGAIAPAPTPTPKPQPKPPQS